MRKQHHAAHLVEQAEAWSWAWNLVLGVGWVLLAVRGDIPLAWYPTRNANPEFGAVEQSVSFGFSGVFLGTGVPEIRHL